MNQNSMMYGDSKFSIVSNSIKSDPFTFFDLDTLTNMEKDVKVPLGMCIVPLFLGIQHKLKNLRYMY